MASPRPQPTTRDVVVIAQDPSVRDGSGNILRTTVTIPYEELEAGPRGGRVQVVDYDATARCRYEPAPASWIPTPDVVGRMSDGAMLKSQRFHAWNAYAIVMRTLARFEYALGRRVAWGFLGHQLWVAPHAFADANAFYSEDDGALLFGYVPRAEGTIFTSLSHDIVAHETSHALLDGLRTRYTDPSSPEQAAFHEGFSDAVALLSVLASRSVVDALLKDSKTAGKAWRADRIPRQALAVDKLESSPLFGLAEQLGETLGAVGVRRAALRTSIRLKPLPNLLRTMLAQGSEAHDLGELFVAAIMRAYVTIWHHRLISLADTTSGPLSRDRVVEEAVDLAERLSTTAIRAIDYLPVVDVRFADFVRALVTADEQVFPDDSRCRMRFHVAEVFRAYGVHDGGRAVSHWEAMADGSLSRSGLHLLPLQTDPTECFHYLWSNRKAFAISDDAFVRVQSVRPAVRQAKDGAFVRETVVEYIEHIELLARELRRKKIRKPDSMPGDARVTLYGGGALILDEFGAVKFHVKSGLFSDKQSERLESLWDHGYFRDQPRARPRRRAFAQLHLRRATAFIPSSREDW